MDPLTAVLLYLGYFLIGNFIANRYFARRHGVRGRLGTPRAFDAGFLGAALVSLTWPVSMWLSSVREPALCGHGHHVLARAGTHRDVGTIQEQLTREHRGEQ